MQMRRLMEIEAQLVNEAENLKVALLVDEPNAYFSARSVGEGVRPDYQEILKIAKSYGTVAQALLIVNPGARIPEKTLPEYEIVRGTDLDCDHLVISCAVAALAVGINVMVLVSGDHRFIDIGKVCMRLGVKFVAVGMPHSTSHLLKTKFPYHPMPTFEPAHFCQPTVAGGDDAQRKYVDAIGAMVPHDAGNARQSDR
jgi:hypothetical protein